jgi:acyl-CoA thioesterase-1
MDKVVMKTIDCKRRAMGLWVLGACLMGPMAAMAAQPATLLVVGDSLSAEYGLASGTGWVALLQGRLDKDKAGFQIVNASISGETTSGGQTRLPALLRMHQPRVVVIELGANDALRGLPVASTVNNLTSMVKASQATGARVLLVGMQVPPNYGKRYTNEFAQAFETVSHNTGASLVPFMLKGVADRPDARDWFQADGIHPQAKAHPLILEVIWPSLKPLLLGRQTRP